VSETSNESKLGRGANGHRALAILIGGADGANKRACKGLSQGRLQWRKFVMSG
jgi:hypothetical protein